MLIGKHINKKIEKLSLHIFFRKERKREKNAA